MSEKAISSVVTWLYGQNVTGDIHHDPVPHEDMLEVIRLARRQLMDNFVRDLDTVDDG